VARRPGFQQGGGDPEGEQHPAAAEVADEVHRGQRPLPRAPHLPQGARQRDVVDVVADRARERAVLPPAGHPAVDDARIAREAVVRAESQALGDPRPETLDETVGILHQVEDERPRVGVLEVDADRGARPVEEVPVRPVGS
jgi:hypothetical protein